MQHALRVSQLQNQLTSKTAEREKKIAEEMQVEQNKAYAALYAEEQAELVDATRVGHEVPSRVQQHVERAPVPIERVPISAERVPAQVERVPAPVERVPAPARHNEPSPSKRVLEPQSRQNRAKRPGSVPSSLEQLTRPSKQTGISSRDLPPPPTRDLLRSAKSSDSMSNSSDSDEASDSDEETVEDLRTFVHPKPVEHNPRHHPSSMNFVPLKSRIKDPITTAASLQAIVLTRELSLRTYLESEPCLRLVINGTRGKVLDFRSMTVMTFHHNPVDSIWYIDEFNGKECKGSTRSLRLILSKFGTSTTRV